MLYGKIVCDSMQTRFFVFGELSPVNDLLGKQNFLGKRGLDGDKMVRNSRFVGEKMDYILINQSDLRMPRQFIIDWLDAAMLILKKQGQLRGPQSEISVVFLNKFAARKLNRDFRGRDYATDILSFTSSNSLSLGELVLCPDVIKRQAAEHGLRMRAELGYMLIHGVLHLLGYDHEIDPKEAEKMFYLQDQIFDKLYSRFWK